MTPQWLSKKLKPYQFIPLQHYHEFYAISVRVTPYLTIELLLLILWRDGWDPEGWKAEQQTVWLVDAAGE